MLLQGKHKKAVLNYFNTANSYYSIKKAPGKELFLF